MDKNYRKAIKIPSIVYTNTFLKFVEYYANKFKKTNGYGRWLAEYSRMDEQGMFEPKKLRELYIDILKGTSKLTYIYWDAVNFICIYALDAAKAYEKDKQYEIRVITGEIALDDDDKKLIELSLEDAISICKAMNTEAEETLFNVCNMRTNKIINFI